MVVDSYPNYRLVYTPAPGCGVVREICVLELAAQSVSLRILPVAIYFKCLDLTGECYYLQLGLVMVEQKQSTDHLLNIELLRVVYIPN